MFSRPIARKLMLAMMAASLALSGAANGAGKREKVKQESRQRRLKINPITEADGAWAVNTESNIYRAGTFQNLTFHYSAHNGWDAGVSLLNVEIIGGNKNFQGDTFINLAHTFNLNDVISVTAASQNGLALAHVHPRTWFNFNFIDGRFDLMPRLSMHGGVYLANKAITGTSRQVGFLAGAELMLVENQLSLQMDYLSGRHSLSGANVSMAYNLTPECQFYLGVLVPAHHSGNEFAGIVGFNLATHPL